LPREKSHKPDATDVDVNDFTDIDFDIDAKDGLEDTPTQITLR